MKFSSFLGFLRAGCQVMEAETLVHGPRMWAILWFREGVTFTTPADAITLFAPLNNWLTEHFERWWPYPKLRSLGHICQQLLVNFRDLKDFLPVSQWSFWLTSQGLKFYTCQTPGKGLCRFSAFSVGNLATHRYLFNVYSTPLSSYPTNANIFNGAVILRICIIYGWMKNQENWFQLWFWDLSFLVIPVHSPSLGCWEEQVRHGYRRTVFWKCTCRGLQNKKEDIKHRFLLCT